MKYETWKGEVDALFKSKTGCTWADLCGDEEPLSTGYQSGETPAEFVSFYVEKYDLTTAEEIGL